MKKVLARQQETFSRQFKLEVRFEIRCNGKLSDAILIAENSIRTFIEFRIQSRKWSCKRLSVRHSNENKKPSAENCQ